MEKKNWEPCPRCGSNRVQAYSRLLFALVGIAMIGISIWLLIIPFIGLFGILFGLFILILSPFAKGMLHCEDCGFTWKYPYKGAEQGTKQ